MWKRNLLFLGIVAAGIAMLVVNLFPSEKRTAIAHLDVAHYPDGFQSHLHKVNAAFQQDWADNELKPAGTAPELAQLRRLHLALIGSAPSLQEIREFEALEGEDRIQRWLGHLLKDRRFADYFAERLARAYVGTEDGPFVLYRRRRFVTWLSDQMYKNTPYDQIVRELISTDGFSTDKPATNFVAVTIANDKPPDAERLAGRVTRAFLGIRLDCAQCHDHPFQNWKQADFQGLAGYFGQSRMTITGIKETDNELELENRKTLKKEKIAPRVPFNPELKPENGNRREQLAGWVTAKDNPYFAQATVNRIWALVFGRPLVDPVDDLPAAVNPPKALQVLADDFAANGFDLQRLIRTMVASQPFQLDSAADHEITDAHEKAWAAFPLTRLRPEQVIGSVLQAATVSTNDGESHILWRAIRFANSNDFVKRYGDTGEDEFDGRSGTIPQRLLLMNGTIAQERIEAGMFSASTRIALQAPTDKAAIEATFLTLLTRRPSPDEFYHFCDRLANKSGGERSRRVEDLFWTLMNASEFSWNH